MPATTNHVAVLAFPFGTHAAPLLTLVRRLSAAAPHLHFSFLSTAKSNNSTFPHSFGDKIKPYHVHDGLPENYVHGGNHLEIVEFFLKEAPSSFNKGMEAATAETGEEIGCLISDAFFWFVGDMAREMEVPWLAVWTSAPRPLLVHMDTDLIWEKIKSHGPDAEDGSLDFLPGFSRLPLRVADLPKEVTSGNLESPFSNMLYKMGHHLPLATAVIMNSFEEIDPEMHNALASRFQNFLNVGPLNIPPPPSFSDEHGCLPWLDKQAAKSVVYISFGGYLFPPPHELTALCEALEDSGFTYLWSFRGNAEENLPKGFLQRAKGIGKIVPWAPQWQVLKHSAVGVFVTHGGWNSVLESIAGGVPMIGRPFIGDQSMNVKSLEHVWGIGLGLEGGVVTKDGLLKVLERVLSSGKGEEMRKRVGVLQSLAYKAVESTGSSGRNLSRLIQIVTK